MTTNRYLGFDFGVPGADPLSPFELADTSPCDFSWGADLAASTFKVGAHTMPMTAREELAAACNEQLAVAASIIDGTIDSDGDGNFIKAPSSLKIGTTTLVIESSDDGLSVDIGTGNYPTAKVEHLVAELLAHVPAQV